MKKDFKTFIVYLIILLLMTPITIFASNEIKVEIDNQYINFDVKPQTINDRTMVPMRAIFEALGARVSWNNETQTVFADRNDTTVTASIGSEKMYINDQVIIMDVAPVLVDSRTLVPVRFIAEAFEYNVEWNEASNTVIISRTGVFDNGIQTYLSDDGTRHYYFQFESGVVTSTGSESARNDRIRTSEYIPAKNFHFDIKEGYEYNILYFDTDKKILSSTGFLTNSSKVASDNNIKYIRITMRASDKSDIAKTVDTAYKNLITVETESLEMPETTKPGNDSNIYKSIAPESEGVKNAILNFQQLTDITYKTSSAIPHTLNAFKVPQEYTGLPYSSTRPEALFVPNNVSLHTYMTAIQNPNSYQYTVNLGDIGNQNGHTYYGAVCSTACGYALNIEPIYSTHQWAEIPGMEKIDVADAYDLKLCDTIVGRGHVIMVTDITKNSQGEIGHITITEAKNPKCVSTKYTVEQINEEIEQYKGVVTFCRYNKLNEIKYTPSPYVAVGYEEKQEIKYNTDIIPRKGDMSNWLYGTDVEIDIFNNSYTNIEIYKDDKLFKTQKTSELITLSNLGYGNYKARLTNGINTSDWCYFMVVDAKSKATPIGSGGKVNVTFSASNATPLYIQWMSTDNGTVHISTLTEDEIKNGSATCSYTPGKYKVRVAFKTDYGIIFSEIPEAITVH